MPTSKDAARQETPRSDGQAEQLRFRRGYLDGAPNVLNVPADHRRPSGPGRRDGVQPFALGAGLTARLQELSRPEQDHDGAAAARPDDLNPGRPRSAGPGRRGGGAVRGR